MTDDELISYIIADRQHNITNYFAGWFTICDRFKNFSYHNRDKIRSKIRGTKTNEDLEDLSFELEVAYLLLLDERFELEYEKYGTGENRAPDFLAIYKKSIFFNVEVRRIRKPELGTRIDSCFQEIGDKVRKIPSDICVQIWTNTFDADPDLVSRLESSKEKIINFVEKVIEIEKNKLAYDSTCEYPLDGFEDEFVFALTRPSGKVDKTHTSYYPASVPIFYTQKEYYKFGDIVCEKLGQMLPNMINMLIVGSNSSAHEREDLPRAIDSINDLLLKNDEKFFIQKGFHGRNDFIEQMKNLSAILFRSNWIGGVGDRNLLWLNEQASQKIPEEITEYLRMMDTPRK